jgi:hypothetical protein
MSMELPHEKTARLLKEKLQKKYAYAATPKYRREASSAQPIQIVKPVPAASAEIKERGNIDPRTNKPFVSTVARRSNADIEKERWDRMMQSDAARNTPWTTSNWREKLAMETQSTGDKFRVSLNPNFFDDRVNPGVMLGTMASSLGSAPLRAKQQNSYMPYVTAAAAPLTVGAIAGFGATSTHQFANNLVNPLAGLSVPAVRIRDAVRRGARGRLTAASAKQEAARAAEAVARKGSAETVESVAINTAVDDTMIALPAGGIKPTVRQNYIPPSAKNPNIKPIDNHVVAMPYIKYRNIQKVDSTPLAKSMEPYISSKVVGGKEQEIFESAFPADVQARMIEARTVRYNNNFRKGGLLYNK